MERDAALLRLAEAEKLKQGYYDEALKGWEKFRAAELQVAELKDLLRSWMQVSNIAQDLTFVPIYKTTEKVVAEKPKDDICSVCKKVFAGTFTELKDAWCEKCDTYVCKLCLSAHNMNLCRTEKRAEPCPKCGAPVNAHAYGCV